MCWSQLNRRYVTTRRAPDLRSIEHALRPSGRDAGPGPGPRAGRSAAGTRRVACADRPRRARQQIVMRGALQQPSTPNPSQVLSLIICAL